MSAVADHLLRLAVGALLSSRLTVRRNAIIAIKAYLDSLPASAIEARRAETEHTGSVHESAVRDSGDAQTIETQQHPGR